MPSTTKPRRTPAKRALLSITGSPTDWGGELFVYGDRRDGSDLRHTILSLDIRGEFTTPVRGTTAFVLRVRSEDKPSLGNVEIPCVGVWIAVKPAFDGSVNLSHREFDLVLAMAASGKLASVHLNFQEPRYGKSLIATVSFSSYRPEEA